jgi:hypothetical protein
MPMRQTNSRAALVAMALAMVATAATPAAARAGTYAAIQCAPSHGARAGAFHFRRTSRHFRAARRCGPGGSGLVVAHAQRRTKPRRYGTWTVASPPGTVFIRGSVAARGRGHNAYRTDLSYVTAANRSVSFAHPSRRRFHRYSWRPPAPVHGLAATLICAKRRAICGPSDRPRLFVKAARFRIADSVVPRITGVGGTVLRDAAQRGTERLGIGAGDVGSGIERLLVSVNGVFYGSRSPGCATRGGLALRLAPCPQRTLLASPMNTAAAPFHEGQNSIGACVADYARTAPHSRCVRRTVRVDNDCPISSVRSGTRARFGLGPRSRRTKTIAYGRRPTVAGRISSDAGPVHSATVCVSQRPALHDSQERTIAVRNTGPEGGIRQRLPVGPSRIVYLTYWRGRESLVTRAVRLQVRPKVSLRIRPRGSLHRGTRPRYLVELRGPYRAHRLVHFQAKAPGGRWFDLPGRHGGAHTGARGLARSTMPPLRVSTSYRLRFRVVVPKQSGYPYARGVSHVRKRLVRHGTHG